MTTLSDPPQSAFKLSMLLNDKRYRGYTFQFIALVCVAALFAYLGSNLIQNLQAAGLEISFSFLRDPANYDINQTLIEYNNQMDHWRAALVGVLNTLLVSLLACITATIIGVFAGVARLSQNWLLRKLMSAYVEAFRNVPVLIWPGGWTVMAFFLGGIIGAFYYRRYATKLLYDTGKLLPMGWPALLIAFVPAILVFFLLGRPITLEYPELGGFNFNGGINILGSLIALWFALAIYTGAFIAENVRAGILSVSKGQTEAAASLGLRPRRIMNLVVLPQALRVIIPPLISHYLNITKNSSLAIAVGYMDLTGTLGGITLNQTGRAIECILLLMAFYLTISLSISAIMNVYNNSVKLKER